MSPTPRVAALIALAALGALVLPVPVVAIAMAAVVAAMVVDARWARRRPVIARRLPPIVSRGVSTRVEATPETGRPGRLRVRQPLPPDLTLEPSEQDDGLASVLVAHRRGRHLLAPLAVRAQGPLGLGAWTHTVGEEHELLVYPDVVSAQRLAIAVRQGRFRDAGQRSRGPLGIGLEFESVRDYLPDDDIRQVNWRATARLGRPMSNQHRVEQDRDVVCVLDAGRLMAAPLGSATRLDVAIDAAVAVAAVADVVGDRCGALAFDERVRRSVAPRHRGADAVTRALFDVEPSGVDSDYDLAFRQVASGKRALVLVLTDLVDEAAARALIEAMPVLARRHAVTVASAADPDLRELLTSEPQSVHDAYAAAVAVDVLDARRAVARALRAAGADVVEAEPARLGEACVRSYLRAKARARL